MTDRAGRSSRRAPDRSDPLAGITRVIVDGNNLLHAMTDRAGGAPPTALIARLRSAVPSSVSVDLVFDGPGRSRERIASSMDVRHAGRRSADDVIVSTVDEAFEAIGPSGTDAILVVTDDGALRARVASRGVRVAGARWLLGRLDRMAGNRMGGTRAPGAPPRTTEPGRPGERSGATPEGAAPDDPATADDPDERPGWRAGRGATVKRGNPRRRPRHARH